MDFQVATESSYILINLLLSPALGFARYFMGGVKIEINCVFC